MKRFLSGMLFVCAGLGAASSQTVDFYDFSADTAGAAYVPLTGTTLLQESAQIKGGDFKNTFFNASESLLYNGEDTVMPGIGIGFDFQFNGETFNRFIASGMGYILLGTENEEGITISGNTNVQTVRILHPRIGIGPSNDVYGVANTSIAYKLEGTAPNQILSVEFTGMAYEEEAMEEETFNYQIRLYQSDNHIEMVFDGFTVPEEAISFADTWAIGLSGAGGGNNVNTPHYRVQTDGNWCRTTQGTNNMGSRNVAGSVFKEGLKYTFTLPAACEAPTEKITDLVLKPTSTSVQADVYVDSTGHAEGYLLLASTEPITGTPDGAEYETGDALLGGTVVEAGWQCKLNCVKLGFVGSA